MSTAHTWYDCGPNCERLYCPWHDGGLSTCTVCGGLEGSLPTDCPGTQMTEEQGNQVYEETLDYKDGAWVKQEQATGAAQ